VTGLVTLDRIKHVSASQRDRTRLADIAHPLAGIVTAAPDDSVADILPRLADSDDRRVLVTSEGHLTGIITPSDIMRAVDQFALARPQ
jgi:CBS domain-containing protein